MHLREAKKALGQPSYEDEHVLLYHGDCCAFMDRLPPEIFDLVVTSPPYNIDKDYEAKLPLE
jgi:adenine-specific DNA-methyltransferase